MPSYYTLARLGENGALTAASPTITYTDFTVALNDATAIMQDTFDNSSVLILQAIAQVAHVSPPITTTFLVSVGPVQST